MRRKVMSVGEGRGQRKRVIGVNTVAAADELHIKTRTMESDSHPGTNTFFFLLDGMALNL